MKVAIIINYWKNSPGGGGGIKTYIVNLTEELKKSSRGISLQMDSWKYIRDYDKMSAGVC